MGIPLSLRWEKLEGHESSQPGVLGLIHHPISSSAKLLDNAVSRCRRLAVGWCLLVLHSRRILGVSIHASQSRGSLQSENVRFVQSRNDCITMSAPSTRVNFGCLTTRGSGGRSRTCY